MIAENEPVDPIIHETAIRIARRCRHTVECILREEEWQDADREFYLIIRDELERLLSSQGHHLKREGGGVGN